MLAHLLDISIRCVALALIAKVVLWALGGRRTAAVEHAVWTAVACGMFGLFVFGSVLPRLPVRVLRSAAVHFAQPTEVTLPAAVKGAVERKPAPQAPTRREIDWIRWGMARLRWGFWFGSRWGCCWCGG